MDARREAPTPTCSTREEESEWLAAHQPIGDRVDGGRVPANPRAAAGIQPAWRIARHNVVTISCKRKSRQRVRKIAWSSIGSAACPPGEGPSIAARCRGSDAPGPPRGHITEPRRLRSPPIRPHAVVSVHARVGRSPDAANRRVDDTRNLSCGGSSGRVSVSALGADVRRNPPEWSIRCGPPPRFFAHHKVWLRDTPTRRESMASSTEVRGPRG